MNERGSSDNEAVVPWPPPDEPQRSVTFTAGQIVEFGSLDELIEFTNGPPAAPIAQVDITDLMLVLWLRLLANIGLVAGVVRPECFGWPAGTRVVVRR